MSAPIIRTPDEYVAFWLTALALLLSAGGIVAVSVILLLLRIVVLLGQIVERLK